MNEAAQESTSSASTPHLGRLDAPSDRRAGRGHVADPAASFVSDSDVRSAVQLEADIHGVQLVIDRCPPSALARRLRSRLSILRRRQASALEMQRILS